LPGLGHGPGRRRASFAGGLSLRRHWHQYRRWSHRRHIGRRSDRWSAGVRGPLCPVRRRLPSNTQAYCPLWGGAGRPAQGARMIDTLAGALGFGVQDPSFWMPLVFMVLLFAIIVAAAVLDGFDIGVGCLALFAPAHLRPRML